MKKLTTILLFASLYANALGIKILETSFNDSTPIKAGSEQLIRLKLTAGYNSGDWTLFSIQHVNDDNTLDKRDTLLYGQFGTLLGNAEKQPDESYIFRVKVPANFKGGKFMATVFGYTLDKTYGIIETPNSTGLEDEYYQNNANVKEVYFFSLQGVEIHNPSNYEGIVIEKRVYQNGKVLTRKRYLN